MPCVQPSGVWVDDQSEVNCISDILARVQGLVYEENDDDWTIQTPTGEEIPIHHYAYTVFTVAGVTKRIKVHIIPVLTPYALLLGQPWLRQMQAVVKDKKGVHSISIRGSDNKMKKIGQDDLKGYGHTTFANLIAYADGYEYDDDEEGSEDEYEHDSENEDEDEDKEYNDDD